MNTAGLVTMEQHILMEQRRFHPDATGEFSWLLSGINLATKAIAANVRSAGLAGLLGSEGRTNVQGETVQKLDAFANQVLLYCLGSRGNVAVMASEEDEEPIVVSRDRESGRYVVIFDPLDGSSNIDVNVSVGTIFSIFRLRARSGMQARAAARCPSARSAPGRGRVRGLWLFHDGGVHDRKRRFRLHARSVHRRLRHQP